MQRINEIKSQFFKNINKIDKPIYKLTKRQRKKIKINKFRNENGDIRDTKEIQRTKRTSFNNLNATKLENTEEINNFLFINLPNKSKLHK